MAKSTYLDNALLNAVLVNTAYTSPATVYVALYTATPGPSGGGTEVSGGSYARTACTFSAASSGSLTNSADCTFRRRPRDGARLRISESSTQRPVATFSTTAR